MPGPYNLARGTTFRILAKIRQLGQPVDLTGHHIVFTCKQTLLDTDPGIAQFDNIGGGAATGNIVVQTVGTVLPDGYITVAGDIIVTMLDVVTQALPNPVTTSGAFLPTKLYYNITDNDGFHDTWETESSTINLTPRVGTTQP